MATLNVTTALVGQSFVFTTQNTENINDILNQVTETPCTFTVEYNDVTYTGHGMRVGVEIVVTMDTPVVLPTGMCFEFDCSTGPVNEEERDCRDNEVTFSENARLAVLDNDGCLVGWVLLENIINHIAPGEPQTLCEAMNVNSIPGGDLVAGDRLLTIDQNCNLKSIPVSDIVCGA